MNRKISQNLSSNTLFHFTNKFDYLKSIFQNGFQARYCYEKLPSKKLAYFAPIVCFCDIPLGSIKIHLSRYGGYGIGVNQYYFKNIGVTPLHYIHSNSPHINITGSHKNIEELKNNPITPYLKPYLGYDPVFEKSTRTVIDRKKIKYLNEKEWRFVPKGYKIEFMKYKTLQELVDYKDSINNSLTDYQYLKIDDLSKIEYIILSRKSEIPEFIKFIETLKYFNGYSKEILISNIVLQGKILRDF